MNIKSYIDTEAFDTCPIASSLASFFLLLGAAWIVWADWKILAGLCCLGIWKQINKSVQAVIKEKKKPSYYAFSNIPKNEVN